MFGVFINFYAFITTQTSLKLKFLRTNNGGECINSQFTGFSAENGIKREHTAPYSATSNGVVERYNKTPCERFQCMLSTANLPNAFWREALQTAVHIINRSQIIHSKVVSIPTQITQSGIPEEIWSDKSSSYDHLFIFGCEAFVHVRQELRNKLDAKSIKGIQCKLFDVLQILVTTSSRGNQKS